MKKIRIVFNILSSFITFIMGVPTIKSFDLNCIGKIIAILSFLLMCFLNLFWLYKDNKDNKNKEKILMKYTEFKTNYKGKAYESNMSAMDSELKLIFNIDEITKLINMGYIEKKTDNKYHCIE